MKISSSIVRLVSVLVLLGTASCGHKKSKERKDEVAPTFDKTPVVPSGELPIIDDKGRVVYSGGQYIQVTMINGIAYIPVEGIFHDRDFAIILDSSRRASTSAEEVKVRLDKQLGLVTDKLKEHVSLLDIKTRPEIGYFSALAPYEAYQQIGRIENLPYTVVINPVLTTPFDEKVARPLDAEAGNILKNARVANDAFSGLVPIGAPALIETLKSQFDIAIDGSTVTVGVADTGITFNHPSFEDAAGKNRIVYMKDFTAEGKVYFNPKAAFEVREPTAAEVPEGLGVEDVLIIAKAEVIPPTKGHTLPPADQYAEILEQKIITNPELRSELLTAQSGAKLGAIAEESYAAEAEKIDINQNGKTDDMFFAIVVPTGDSYKIYVDLTGEGDFRKAKAVHDWNSSQETMKVLAEVFGLDVRKAKLQTIAGQEEEVLSAAIVGIDPGMHGSHVSGIIAGRKTISNDSDATLARGVAPNAKIMMNRVCANNGGCSATEAVIDLALNGAEIVNMSLGGLSVFNDGYSVEEIVIDRLTDMEKVLFVISAGNSGPGRNTVGSPSTARTALSVGATANANMIEKQYQWPGKGRADDATDDFMLFFSSRGPSAAGGFKPEISAPGTQLSAQPLNGVEGVRTGSNVFWGTSMAAPTASGAVALLMDAAKKYNAKFSADLPTDPTTIKKVLLASARPFDVTRFDPDTNALTRGQYTWIDQGAGMIDLPQAWKSLLAERETKIPSAVYAEESGVKTGIDLDYQVRVLRTNPNGINYDGTLQLPPEVLEITGPRFGRGIWLDAKEQDSLIPVQIARRLPVSATERDDVGELQRLLRTTQDEFEIKTVFYGSSVAWLKAGSLEALDCNSSSVSKRLTVVGEGAIDNFGAEKDKSVSSRESTLYVCVDRAKLNALPPGDHGALILARRASGDKVEANASFIVPVYITVPQKTLAGNAGYEIEGSVDSFQVARHYVNVAEGTSMVKVTLEVPEAVAGQCAGVRLYVLEGDNSTSPSEIEGNIVTNCSASGAPSNEKRTLEYIRLAPKAGTWNLHVFGRYQFAHSPYKLSVEYANIKLSKDQIGDTEASLNGELELGVVDASIELKPDATTSVFALNGLTQTIKSPIATGDVLKVPDLDGKTFRSYSEDVVTVTIGTDGSPGNDLDLTVYECEAEQEENCVAIGQSAGATDLETVEFTPNKAKFYVAEVSGFDVSQGDKTFVLTEKLALATSDAGKITVTELAENTFNIKHELAIENSVILKHPLYVSGKYSATGNLELKDAKSSGLVRVPVLVKKVVP
ncbi:MAG: S8 family serine peptidase [Oligoflexales bacterium]